MSEKPIVSIIIPSYNYGRLIGETLESLQKQTLENWECIVVDDGSVDNTKSVVAVFVQKDPRFKYIYQENKGLPASRNTGIDASKGTYLQFIDADDLLESQKLELQVEAFKNDPNLDFVYSPVMFFYDGRPDQLRYSSYGYNFPWALTKSGNGKSLMKYLVISCVLMPPMPLIKREAVIAVGSFSAHLKSMEDWDFWLRCALADLNMKYIDKKNTRSLMRLHDSNMTKKRPLMVEGLVKMREGLLAGMIEGDQTLKKCNQKLLISDWIELALVKYKYTSKEEGSKYLADKRLKVSSFRLSCFSLFMKIFPNKFNLFLLSLSRTFMKKWLYWRLS